MMKKPGWVISVLSAFLLPSFLVVLTASASTGSPQNLRPDAVTSGGPLGNLFQISFTDTDAKDPAIAYHPQRHEYLVVWKNDLLNNSDIHAQRVSATGMLVGNPFFVSTGPGGDRYQPDVVYNSKQQEYLVIWAIDPPGPPGFEFHAQAVAAQGGITGPDITFATGVYSAGGLHVAYSPVSDKYLVVWSTPGIVTQKVYGQVLNSDGSTSAPNFDITGPLLNVGQALVAFNRSRNEYLVVWSEYFSGGTTRDVRARRVQGNGTPMYPDNLALTALPDDQWAAAVAAMPTEPDKGEYLVGFEDGTPVAVYDLMALRVTGEGQVQGAHFPVSESPDDDVGLAIAADEHNLRYLLVNERKLVRIPHRPSIILGREVSLEGQPLGSDTGIAGEQATTPAVAAGRAGDYLVVFADKPATPTFDIYGRLWGLHRVFLPVVLR